MNESHLKLIENRIHIENPSHISMDWKIGSSKIPKQNDKNYKVKLGTM